MVQALGHQKTRLNRTFKHYLGHKYWNKFPESCSLKLNRMMRALISCNRVTTQYYREDESFYQTNLKRILKRDGCLWFGNCWRDGNASMVHCKRKLSWRLWDIKDKKITACWILALRNKVRYLIEVVSCRLSLDIYILEEHQSIPEQLHIRAINEVVCIWTQCLKFCHDDDFKLGSHSVLILSETGFDIMVFLVLNSSTYWSFVA